MKSDIGWWKDLAGMGLSPAHAWLVGYGRGALPKMSAGEDLTGTVYEDDGATVLKHNAIATVWVPFEKGNGTGRVRTLLVAPELVAELTKRRMFRCQTSTLLGSLRGRAVVGRREGP